MKCVIRISLMAAKAVLRGNNMAEACWYSRTADNRLCIQLVKDWAKDNYSTRAKEFLSRYPDFKILSTGCSIVDPCVVEHSRREELCAKYTTCGECNSEYWLTPLF